MVINSHTITALEPQKKNQHRVNVYLDGEFAFGLRRIVAAWLTVGQEIDDEKIKQLRSDDAREEALQRGLRFIDYRPRSVDEVRKNLLEHDIPEDVVDDTIHRFQELDLLDDKRFANMWVENRSEFRPRGKRALAFELRQRGINQETIDTAIEELDEEKLAIKAALKQSRRIHTDDALIFRNKLSGFLARRGFNYEIIQQAVQIAWEQKTNPDPEYETLAEEEEMG